MEKLDYFISEVSFHEYNKNNDMLYGYLKNVLIEFNLLNDNEKINNVSYYFDKIEITILNENTNDENKQIIHLFK